MANSAKQGSDQDPTYFNQSNIINIRFVRLFYEINALDIFYEKICPKLKEIEVDTSINSNEQIFCQDRIMFQLSFTVTYCIDGSPLFYLSRVNKIINNQLPYTISSNKPGQNVIPKTEYPTQSSVSGQIPNYNSGDPRPKKKTISILSKILDPSLFAILPFTAFMIFVAFILMSGDGKNNSDTQQSTPSQTTTPNTSNPSGAKFRSGEKKANPQESF